MIDFSVFSESDFVVKFFSWRVWREYNDGYRSFGVRLIFCSGSEGFNCGEGDVV